VYHDWPTASAQLIGVKRPKHRRFATRAEAEAFVAEGKKGSAAISVAAAQQVGKRRKLINGTVAPPGLVLNDNPQDIQGHIPAPGSGPLPPDAEDGFDPNIKLDIDGNMVYKTEAQKIQTKASRDPQSSSRMLSIYTDGSSLANGTAGARAGVGVYFGPCDSKNVSEALAGARQTNQRAELTAILRALELAPRHRDVTIHTDSRYSIDCVTTWYKGWKRNGWLTASKKPVENRDLIQDVRNKIEERQSLGCETYFVWVKGHSGDPGNMEADRLAVQGAGQALGPKVTPNRPAPNTDTDVDNQPGLSETGPDEDWTEDDEAVEAMKQAMGGGSGGGG
jgi:ribonuclease HI